MNETELKQFQERVDNVVNWLDTYAPKFVKFQVQEKSVPKLPLTDEQTEFLGKLADLMESKEFIEDLISEKEVNVEATMEEATDAE